MEVQPMRVHDNVTRTAAFRIFSEFDRAEAQQWMEKHWTISLYCVAAYVIFIYIGQELMKNRKPYDLRGSMALWNFGLAAFSISACLTIIPEFFQILQGRNGFHKSVCASCNEVSTASVYWGWMFTLSKLAELGDTVFIVLRKRKLIFLHWYHHITVLLYCWYSYADQISPARWFIVVNFFIHSLMYAYYGLRAVGVKVPKPIAMSITLMQLSQMIIGVVVNVYAYRAKVAGQECDVSLHHLNMALGMYASYFALFAHFFYKAYMKTPSKPKIQ